MFLNKFSLYLIYIIPIALVTGNFLPDLILCLIGFFFLINTFRFNLWNDFYNNYYVKCFIAFYLYIVFCSLISSDPFFSLSSSIVYIRYLFYSLAIFYLLTCFPQLPKNLAKIAFFTVFIVILDGYYQFINGHNILGYVSPDKFRLTGFFDTEQIIGGYVARLAPICLGLFLLYKENIKKSELIFFFIFLINCEVLVYLSGERAAFFFMVFFLISLLTFLNKYKLMRVITYIFSLIIIFIITSTNKIVLNRMIKGTIDQVSETSIPYLPYGSHHEAHYISALKMFLDKPFFGVGPNMFRNLCDEEKYSYFMACSTHPHNHYLQLLAETGIFGFLFLLFLFFFIVIILIKHLIQNFRINDNWKLSDGIVVLFIALLIFTWPLIPTGNFFSQWTNIIFYLPVGFILFYFKKIKKLK